MSGTLRVNSVGNASGTYTVTGTYLVSRIVQRQTVNYRDGYYRPVNTYYWAPGCWLWFQPSRPDSHIRFSMNVHLRWYSAAYGQAPHEVVKVLLQKWLPWHEIYVSYDGY